MVLVPKNWVLLDELRKLPLSDRHQLGCLDRYTAIVPGSSLVES